MGRSQWPDSDLARPSKHSPGSLLVSQGAPVRLVAERVVFLWAVCDPADLADRAMHLPSLVYHAFVR